MAIERPTPELTREICESLATGMLLADAAALAGVDRQTLAEWKRLAEKGTEPYAATRHELVKAELLAQRRLLTKLSPCRVERHPKYAGVATHSPLGGMAQGRRGGGPDRSGDTRGVRRRRRSPGQSFCDTRSSPWGRAPTSSRPS